jgi:hypothetical protein
VVVGRDEEIDIWEDGTPEDYEEWYSSGMVHYEEGEWVKAYNCFKNAEVVALEKASEICKSFGRIESAEIYRRRVKKAELQELKLATPETTLMRDFFIITGIIALITFILIFVFWPTLVAILFLILFLIDLLIFLLLIPYVVVKHATSRKKPVSEFSFKIRLVELQLEKASQQGTTGTELLQVEKLKQKRARLAQQMARRAYTDSQIHDR